MHDIAGGLARQGNYEISEQAFVDHPPVSADVQYHARDHIVFDRCPR